jgi:uncharacterized phiE125 gp8 family phage protein
MPYVLVTAPALEPISLEEAKAWCRVDAPDEDTIITALIKAAREFVERETNRCLIEQDWRLDLDGFPASTCDRGVIRLAKGPVSEVSTFTYFDAANASQTLSVPAYLTDDLPGDYPRLVPGIDLCWPDYQRQPGAVRIEFTAGYGPLATDVPDALRVAIRFLVEHWTTNRGPVGSKDLAPLSLAAEALIASYRLPFLA